METITSKITNRPKSFPFICTHDTLRCIFYNQQIMSTRDIHDRIHLTGNSRIMNRHNCPCLFGNRILDQFFIYIHCIRSDIYKFHSSATQNKGVCCRYKSIRRHDDFIPRLNICQNRCHLRRMCTRSRQ